MIGKSCLDARSVSLFLSFIALLVAIQNKDTWYRDSYAYIYSSRLSYDDR